MGSHCRKYLREVEEEYFTLESELATLTKRKETLQRALENAADELRNTQAQHASLHDVVLSLESSTQSLTTALSKTRAERKTLHSTVTFIDEQNKLARAQESAERAERDDELRRATEQLRAEENSVLERSGDSLAQLWPRAKANTAADGQSAKNDPIELLLARLGHNAPLQLILADVLSTAQLLAARSYLLSLSRTRQLPKPSTQD